MHLKSRNITRKSNLPPSSKVNKFIWQFLGANLTDFSQIEVEIKPNYPSEVQSWALLFCQSPFYVKIDSF